MTEKIFDWMIAVDLIHLYGIKNAVAGLAEDMLFSGGAILENGEPIHDQPTFLASTWATPVLVDMDTGNIHKCHSNTTLYNEHTKWPPEALALLKVH